jgi:hypothetical protein
MLVDYIHYQKEPITIDFNQELVLEKDETRWRR